jgi:ABC-type transport system involved in cytochrome bd biosynthesis fused ATPase/permease subunit
MRSWARPQRRPPGAAADSCPVSPSRAEAYNVLLLDEPTNDLDTNAEAMVARMLARWERRSLRGLARSAALAGMDRILELHADGNGGLCALS